MTEPNNDEMIKNNADIEEAPPFGKSWKRLYRIVIVNLVALILIFYIISKTLA